MKALDGAVVALAARQHGVFRRRQLYGQGFTRSACDRRLSAGLWLRTRHAGVYALPASARSWQQRLCAAVLAGPDGTVASHRSAAVLHGVREGTVIEVSVPPKAHNSIRGVRIHRLQLLPAERTAVAGIPVTSVERTLVDLAAVVGDDEVERAVEAALRQGLTNENRLRRRLEELTTPGRRGAARLRRVLEKRAEGRPAGSDLEVRMIQHLRDAGLGDPVRQYEVRVGGSRYFLDLAYPDRGLAIELDGYEPHSGGEAFQHDRTRQNALVLAGWTILRFTWADVTERPEQVVALITRALAA